MLCGWEPRLALHKSLAKDAFAAVILTLDMGPPSKIVPAGAEEALLLGRRGVSGIVNASRLANIVRTLRSSASNAHRPTYWLWCSEQGLQVRGPKYDEGFESDDSASTKSGGEVEERAGDTSSGVSDLDDQVTTSDSGPPRIPQEQFAIRDIVFCHSDPSFPRVLVWVVNGPRRPSPACMEALVFECRSEASVRRLSSCHQETSRRLKMQMLSAKRMAHNQPVLPDRMDTLLPDRWRDKYVRQREPPTLLSMPVPEDEWDEPPRRPERRRFVRRKPQEDILRGTFVRVNVVDPKPSPVLLKPQFTWMYGVPATAELVLSQSAPVNRSRRSCRSVSPSMSRRTNSKPLRYAPEPAPSHGLVQGLTQKLKELAPIAGTLKRCSRNREQHQFSTLKPVIKKTSKKHSEGDLLAEPKKVTFSAYATVQVVD
ncbi:uncharacterized protein LOC132203596 isoform X2 [Neocloeon triangulifer]|uniref:uncharacterized protein LOC132203596 isoform X2 n=1 Tax=Neocloeon triangulifer TaxID=2078957 RepID=UPI00286F2F65|nr:uncharacterized protein LOC132203596 isoform X2 [Neocloeon triangulifer]XP_059487457.1 uncharacterized protein LOC132203596 isoform X2 [Neocloeon triangulifer]